MKMRWIASLLLRLSAPSSLMLVQGIDANLRMVAVRTPNLDYGKAAP